MKINLRSGFRVFAWVIAAFLFIWMLVWMYVLFNKKSIIKQVTTELSKKIKGEIKIGDLDPSLISTFPHVSLRLSQVVVRDTLWDKHHHDLLKAEKIFIRLGLLSLFAGSPEIGKVIIEKGSVYLFNDSTGYTNEYMLKSQNSNKADISSKSAFPNIELKNVRVTLALQNLNKLYDFDISRLRGDIKTRDSVLRIDVKAEMLVHSLAFNTYNGSFIEKKPVAGKFHIFYNLIKKKLEFKNVVLQVDRHPFTFSGMFDISDAPPLYFLSVQSNKLNYRRTSSLLSNNISKKLDSFNIEKPIDVYTTIDGTTRPNKIPLIKIEVSVKNNRVSTPIGVFTDASFTGYFSNQLILSERRVDKNSGFNFTSFSGKWENITLNADTIKISNLEHPVLDCDIRSSFNLKELNDLLGTNSIEFTKGLCKVDLTYKGLIIEGDTAGASINGNISLEKASINYIPRNLLLSNCSGKLIFDDKDFYIKQLKAETKNSQLLMNGSVKNLTSLIDKSPDKLLLNWNIASPKLDLSDFISFLGKRSASTRSTKKRFLKLANQIDRMLNDCNMQFQLNADRLIYKKFDGTNIAANLKLTDRLLSLDNVLVQHAGGTLTLNGSLQEDASYNVIKLKSIMNNVDITKVFSAFNNFGQDGITDKNLRGRLAANIDITGSITDKAEIVQNSLKGVIDFRLKNGELINFEPVMKISQIAFKNRDFSHIQFAELNDILQVNGSEIKVNRMEIQSSVFTMFVEGIYDVKKGTDLSIQIPLSNLAKRGEEFELKNKGVRSKTGVSLRLRARTGDDGKAKISWDPFNKALKKTDNTNTDSTNVTKPNAARKKIN